MSKQVTITKMSESTREGMTKVQFLWEELKPDNTKRTGEGRFAILAGNLENYVSCITQDLSKRLGGAISLTMPPKYQQRLDEIMAARAKAEGNAPRVPLKRAG